LRDKWLVSGRTHPSKWAALRARQGEPGSTESVAREHRQLSDYLWVRLEQMVTGRPKPVSQIEEQYREDWSSADGVTVDGLDEPVDRPEPPDRSGARL
jgi:hypothetical protein